MRVGLTVFFSAEYATQLCVNPQQRKIRGRDQLAGKTLGRFISRQVHVEVRESGDGFEGMVVAPQFFEDRVRPGKYLQLAVLAAGTREIERHELFWILVGQRPQQ